MDRSWEYINRSQTHECRNWAEAAQFPEKEYVNGIAFAVHLAGLVFYVYVFSLGEGLVICECNNKQYSRQSSSEFLIESLH